MKTRLLLMALAATSAHAAARADAQLFTGYRLDAPAEADLYDEYFLDRAEVGLSLGADAGAELRLEAVRAISRQSLVGVDGDSLVVRVKRAWAWYALAAGPLTVQLDGGLVPDPWVEGLERAYPLRGLSPLLVESGGFFDTSDLGLRLGLRTWEDRVRVGGAVLNGEGRNERERNAGKNITATLSVTPLRVDAGNAPLSLSLHGVYRSGSVGVGAARDDRLGGALTLDHRDYGVGGAWVAAQGWDGYATRDADGIEAWLYAAPLVPWPGVVGRFGRLTVEGEVAERLSAGLYQDVGRWVPALERLRLYVVYERETADEGLVAGPTEAAEVQRLLVKVEVAGGAALAP